MTSADDFKQQRLNMVKSQIERRGVADKSVLKVMSKVPRHLFVPRDLIEEAYDDRPLTIGYGQTISQPYIVAYMTEALGVFEGSKVLEIGTGCGYQTAILAALGARVFSLEVVEDLASSARARLENMKIEATILHADGYSGLPSEAPFDGIIGTAAPKSIPHALTEQLKEGGRLVLPVGVFFQDLLVMEKREGQLVQKSSLAVRFVPMVKG